MTDYCISKHTIKELDKYIISQNIILLKKIANDYKINQDEFIKDILSTYIDNNLLNKELYKDNNNKLIKDNNKKNIKVKRCMSRIWNQGYGGQCTKNCYYSNDDKLKDYCKIHQGEIIRKNELRYGRIDEISKFRLNKKPNEPYLRCIHYNIDKHTNKRIQCIHRIIDTENSLCGIHRKK